MEEVGAMTLRDFSRFKVDALKDFLRKRGLKVSGKRKEELAAIAYGASQANVPVVESTEEANKQRGQQYRSLLSTPEGVLPDPFQDLTTGWLGEEPGIKQWPPTMQFDIAQFLLKNGDQNLTKRLMSDYKEGKAFSYFASSFLGEVS